jgi:hypothetical protein
MDLEKCNLSMFHALVSRILIIQYNLVAERYVTVGVVGAYQWAMRK